MPVSIPTSATALLRSAFILTCCVGSLSLVGCRGPDNVMAPNTTADDPLSAGAYPEIVLLDGLERVLVREHAGVVPPDQNESAKSPMRVRTQIRSVVDRNTPIEYRFMFFGPNDQQLTMNPVWQPKTVEARARVELEAHAMTNRAVRYELEIRRAR